MITQARTCARSAAVVAPRSKGVAVVSRARPFARADGPVGRRGKRDDDRIGPGESARHRLRAKRRALRRRGRQRRTWTLHPITGVSEPAALLRRDRRLDPDHSRCRVPESRNRTAVADPREWNRRGRTRGRVVPRHGAGGRHRTGRRSGHGQGGHARRKGPCSARCCTQHRRALTKWLRTSPGTRLRSIRPAAPSIPTRTACLRSPGDASWPMRAAIPSSRCWRTATRGLSPCWAPPAPRPCRRPWSKARTARSTSDS